MKDREFDLVKPSLDMSRMFDIEINYKACPHHRRDDAGFVFVPQCLILSTQYDLPVIAKAVFLCKALASRLR